MITLYDYQKRGEHQILEKYSKKIRRVLYQLTTGGGKTVVFSDISLKSSAKGKRILILTHREELLNQGGGTLAEFNIHPQLITPETKLPKDAPVTVSMVLTLKNRLKKPEWLAWFNKIDLIICDECHRAEFAPILALAKCWILRVTATPKRTGKQAQLSSEYDEMIEGPDCQELINMSKLIPDRYFGVQVDIAGVEIDSTGEYNNEQLYNRFNKTEVYGGIIDNWLKICPSTSTIIFCCNIQHCIETARAFNNAGIKAKFVTSSVAIPRLEEGYSISDKVIYDRKIKEYENYKAGYELYSGERDAVVNEWKAGAFHVLINCGIFVEGFDHKPTQTIIIALATTSLNKWLQMIGRGSRIWPGKEYFFLLDFGLNADRLGHYRAQREWSLTHARSKNEGIPSSKTCPRCQALVIASARFCKYCGFEWERTKEEKVAELVEFKYADKIPQKIRFKDMSFDEIDEYARQRGYKKGFVYRQVYMSYGEEGLKIYARQHGMHHKWVEHQMKIYERVKPERKEK